MKVSFVGPLEAEVEQVARALSKEEVLEKVKENFKIKFQEKDLIVTVNKIMMRAPIFVKLDQENDWDIIMPDLIQTDTLSLKVINTKEYTVKAREYIRLDFKPSKEEGDVSC